MSRRMSRDEIVKSPAAPRLLSEFTENEHGEQYFTIRTVPLPPRARRRVVKDHIKETWHEQIYLKLGCPKCHEDIEFRYEAASISPTLMSQLLNVLGEIRSFEFSVIGLLTDRERYNKLVDVAERLMEALQR